MARTSGHHIGVEIHRVRGIGDGDPILYGKDFLQVGEIAASSIGDEDFIRSDMQIGVVVHCNGVPQKRIASTRAIAFEGMGLSHLLSCRREGRYNRGKERMGEIPNA